MVQPPKSTNALWELTIDSRKLADLLTSPQGPVIRRLFLDADVVVNRAKELVGVFRPPDAYSAATRQRRPGTLRDSIVKRVIQYQGTTAVAVGSADPIALIHHEGTVAHRITARRRPRLVFYWRRLGRVFAAPSVNHPGTRPNRFLTKALEALKGRY